jgi:hypothetical protein
MITFKSLPLIVRLGTIANIFIGWELIAEFVIDRYGLDRFLPFYRVGDLCVYDLAVVAGCVVAWRRLNR